MHRFRSLPAGRSAVWAGSHQMSLVTQDPAKQAAAVCWIRWASDHSVKWATAGNIPARTSQANDPSLPQIAPELARVIKVVDKGIILPTQPGLEGALWGSGFGPVIDNAWPASSAPTSTSPSSTRLLSNRSS